MKRTLHILLVGAVALLFLHGCRKKNDPLFDGVNCTGNCFILNGNLIDSAGGTGISGGTIKFYFHEFRGGTFGAKKILLGETITGSGGQYSFRFDGSRFARMQGWFTAEAFKDDYFHDPVNQNTVSVFDLDSTRYNIPFIQQFSLFRPATLRVRVIASTVTNFQYLTVDCSYGKASNGVVLNGGRSIDTTLVFKTAGDLRSFIQADARGNGVFITRYDTLIVPARNSRQIEIRF